MQDKCVFCGRKKLDVPALVTNDQGLTICSLCLEDCLALFCEEGRGITRFIIAEKDSNGQIQIKFPRPKNKISLDFVADGLFQIAGPLVKIIRHLPFIDSRQQQIDSLEAKINSLTSQKADLNDQLKAIETKILLLQWKLNRLREK